MKLLAFILVLLHINSSMFIAQLDEKDVYDSSGQQIRDINSITDFIQNALPKHKQGKHKDNDDDNARYFHALKAHHFFPQPLVSLKKALVLKPALPISSSNESQLSAGFFAIQSPPPKA